MYIHLYVQICSEGRFPECCHSDPAEQLWVWEYQMEDGKHDMFMDEDEPIRFRVIAEEFIDTLPTSGATPPSFSVPLVATPPPFTVPLVATPPPFTILSLPPPSPALVPRPLPCLGAHQCSLQWPQSQVCPANRPQSPRSRRKHPTRSWSVPPTTINSINSLMTRHVLTNKE